MPDGQLYDVAEERAGLEGQTLAGKYRIEARVGVGGFAEVFRAQHLGLGTTVAIKVLKPRWREHERCVQRFEAEAKLCAAAIHPSIVDVFDIGTTADGNRFMVLEYIDGTSMRSRVKRRDIGFREAGAWIAELLHALEAAHRAGVVHGDLKPSNVLLTPVTRKSSLKLIDFGASSPASGERCDVVWGTPEYMAPELSTGAAASVASDIYSAGVMLFELVTGQLPFAGGSPREVLRQHASSPLPEVRGGGVGPLIDVVERAMAKNPFERYRSAAEMARAVSEATEDVARARGRSDTGTFAPASAPARAPAPRSTAALRPRVREAARKAPQRAGGFPTAAQSLAGLRRAIGGAIRDGRLADLPQLYQRCASALADAGNFAAALDEIEEGLSLLASADRLEIPRPRLIALHLRAAGLHRCLGHTWQARNRAREALRLAEACGHQALMQRAQAFCAALATYHASPRV